MILLSQHQIPHYAFFICTYKLFAELICLYSPNLLLDFWDSGDTVLNCKFFTTAPDPSPAARARGSGA